MWIYLCGPGCDWCHRVSVQMLARYSGNKSIPCCTNSTILPAQNPSQLWRAWKGFLREVHWWFQWISDVHSAKLFMNNVRNVLFTLIIGTVFESSLFFWDFFPATSLPKIFLPWFSLRSMSQVFSSWLFGLFHPDSLWILSYLHHYYSDLCFWRQSRES